MVGKPPEIDDQIVTSPIVSDTELEKTLNLGDYEYYIGSLVPKKNVANTTRVTPAYLPVRKAPYEEDLELGWSDVNYSLDKKTISLGTPIEVVEIVESETGTWVGFISEKISEGDLLYTKAGFVRIKDSPDGEKRPPAISRRFLRPSDPLSSVYIPPGAREISPKDNQSWLSLAPNDVRMIYYNFNEHNDEVINEDNYTIDNINKYPTLRCSEGYYYFILGENKRPSEAATSGEIYGQYKSESEIEEKKLQVSGESIDELKAIAYKNLLDYLGKKDDANSMLQEQHFVLAGLKVNTQTVNPNNQKALFAIRTSYVDALPDKTFSEIFDDDSPHKNGKNYAFTVELNKLPEICNSLAIEFRKVKNKLESSKLKVLDVNGTDYNISIQIEQIERFSKEIDEFLARQAYPASTDVSYLAFMASPGTKTEYNHIIQIGVVDNDTLGCGVRETISHVLFSPDPAALTEELQPKINLFDFDPYVTEDERSGKDGFKRGAVHLKTALPYLREALAGTYGSRTLHILLAHSSITKYLKDSGSNMSAYDWAEFLQKYCVPPLKIYPSKDPQEFPDPSTLDCDEIIKQLNKSGPIVGRQEKLLQEQLYNNPKCKEKYFEQFKDATHAGDPSLRKKSLEESSEDMLAAMAADDSWKYVEALFKGFWSALDPQALISLLMACLQKKLGLTIAMEAICKAAIIRLVEVHGPEAVIGIIIANALLYPDKDSSRRALAVLGDPNSPYYSSEAAKTTGETGMLNEENEERLVIDERYDGAPIAAALIVGEIDINNEAIEAIRNLEKSGVIIELDLALRPMSPYVTISVPHGAEDIYVEGMPDITSGPNYTQEEVDAEIKRLTELGYTKREAQALIVQNGYMVPRESQWRLAAKTPRSFKDAPSITTYKIGQKSKTSGAEYSSTEDERKISKKARAWLAYMEANIGDIGAICELIVGDILDGLELLLRDPQALLGGFGTWWEDFIDTLKRMASLEPPSIRFPDNLGTDSHMGDYGKKLLMMLLGMVALILGQIANLLIKEALNKCLEENNDQGPAPNPVLNRPASIAIPTLRRAGLPKVGGISDTDIVKWMKDLVDNLSPGQLCALLRGDATKQTLYDCLSRTKINWPVIHTAGIDTIYEIRVAFEKVGKNLDLDICKVITSSSPIVTETCAAIYDSDARCEELQQAGLTKEECDAQIQNELNDLKNKLMALTGLGMFGMDPTTNLLPPACGENGFFEIPPGVKDSMSRVTDNILKTVKSSLIQDMTSLEFFAVPPRAVLAATDPKELMKAHKMFINSAANPYSEMTFAYVGNPYDFTGIPSNKKTHKCYPITYNKHMHYGGLISRGGSANIKENNYKPWQAFASDLPLSSKDIAGRNKQEVVFTIDDIKKDFVHNWPSDDEAGLNGTQNFIENSAFFEPLHYGLLFTENDNNAFLNALYIKPFFRGAIDKVRSGLGISTGSPSVNDGTEGAAISKKISDIFRELYVKPKYLKDLVITPPHLFFSTTSLNKPKYPMAHSLDTKLKFAESRKKKLVGMLQAFTGVRIDEKFSFPKRTANGPDVDFNALAGASGISLTDSEYPVFKFEDVGSWSEAVPATPKLTKSVDSQIVADVNTYSKLYSALASSENEYKEYLNANNYSIETPDKFEDLYTTFQVDVDRWQVHLKSHTIIIQPYSPAQPSVFTADGDSAAADAVNAIDAAFTAVSKPDAVIDFMNWIQLSPGLVKLWKLNDALQITGPPDEDGNSPGWSYNIMDTFIELTIAEALGLESSRISGMFPSFGPIEGVEGVVFTRAKSNVRVFQNPDQKEGWNRHNVKLTGQTLPQYIKFKQHFADPDSPLNLDKKAMVEYFSSSKEKVNPELYSALTNPGNFNQNLGFRDTVVNNPIRSYNPDSNKAFWDVHPGSTKGTGKKIMYADGTGAKHFNPDILKIDTSFTELASKSVGGFSGQVLADQLFDTLNNRKTQGAYTSSAGVEGLFDEISFITKKESLIYQNVILPLENNVSTQLTELRDTYKFVKGKLKDHERPNIVGRENEIHKEKYNFNFGKKMDEDIQNLISDLYPDNTAKAILDGYPDGKPSPAYNPLNFKAQMFGRLLAKRFVDMYDEYNSNSDVSLSTGWKKSFRHRLANYSFPALQMAHVHQVFAKLKDSRLHERGMMKNLWKKILKNPLNVQGVDPRCSEAYAAALQEDINETETGFFDLSDVKQRIVTFYEKSLCYDVYEKSSAEDNAARIALMQGCVILLVKVYVLEMCLASIIAWDSYDLSDVIKNDILVKIIVNNIKEDIDIELIAYVANDILRKEKGLSDIDAAYHRGEQSGLEYLIKAESQYIIKTVKNLFINSNPMTADLDLEILKVSNVNATELQRKTTDITTSDAWTTSDAALRASVIKAFHEATDKDYVIDARFKSNIYTMNYGTGPKQYSPYCDGNGWVPGQIIAENNMTSQALFDVKNLKKDIVENLLTKNNSNFFHSLPMNHHDDAAVKDIGAWKDKPGPYADEEVEKMAQAEATETFLALHDATKAWWAAEVVKSSKAIEEMYQDLGQGEQPPTQEEQKAAFTAHNQLQADQNKAFAELEAEKAAWLLSLESTRTLFGAYKNKPFFDTKHIDEWNEFQKLNEIRHHKLGNAHIFTKENFIENTMGNDSNRLLGNIIIQPYVKIVDIPENEKEEYYSNMSTTVLQKIAESDIDGTGEPCAPEWKELGTANAFDFIDIFNGINDKRNEDNNIFKSYMWDYIPLSAWSHFYNTIFLKTIMLGPFPNSYEFNPLYELYKKYGFKLIFKEFKIGLRLTYAIPAETIDSTFGNINNKIKTKIEDAFEGPENINGLKECKSLYVERPYFYEGGTNKRIMAELHIPIVEVEKSLTMQEGTAGFTIDDDEKLYNLDELGFWASLDDMPLMTDLKLTELADSFYEPPLKYLTNTPYMFFYKNLAQELMEDLKNSAEFRLIFDHILPVRRYMALGFVYAADGLSKFIPEPTDVLDDTKEKILMIIRNLINSQDFTYVSDQVLSSLGDMNLRAMGGTTGKEPDMTKLILRTIYKTMFMILKGFVEMTDPAVIIAKTVIDIANAVTMGALGMAEQVLTTIKMIIEGQKLFADVALQSALIQFQIAGGMLASLRDSILVGDLADLKKFVTIDIEGETEWVVQIEEEVDGQTFNEKLEELSLDESTKSTISTFTGDLEQVSKLLEGYKAAKEKAEDLDKELKSIVKDLEYFRDDAKKTMEELFQSPYLLPGLWAGLLPSMLPYGGGIIPPPFMAGPPSTVPGMIYIALLLIDAIEEKQHNDIMDPDDPDCDNQL